MLHKRGNLILGVLVLLVAFACRLHAVQAAWIDNDRTYPHALGISVLDSLSSLQLNQLPLLSVHNTIGIRNGAAASYMLAVAGLFDRSMFAGIVFELMLSVLAVAMTFALTRRLWGIVPACIAGLLMATSPWAVYYARGTWVQGPLEFFTVAAAWLAWPALTSGKPRRLIAAFAIAAFAFQTYIAGIGIIAQLMLSCLLAFQRRLARAIFIGLSICALSVLLYVLLLTTSPDGVLMEKIKPLFEKTSQPAQQTSTGSTWLEQRFTRDPFAHALRLVSGRDYMTVWTKRDETYPVRNVLNEARAAMAELLMLAGGFALLLRIRRDPMARVVLGWFGLPIIAGFLAVSVTTTLDIEPMYLLLCSPAGYMLAGASWLLIEKIHRLKKPVVALACVWAACNIFVAGWAFISAADTVYQQPFAGTLNWLPLRWAERIGDVLRTHCTTINDSTDESKDRKLWLTSWTRTTQNIEMESARFRPGGIVWAVRPQGGNCVLRLNRSEAPANSIGLPVTFDDGSRLTIYRSLPYTVTQALMNANLGWSLMNVSTPKTAQAGDTITIRHDWRIDTLPGEPHDNWFFQPYVKLLNSQRQVVAQADNGAALSGWGWRPGTLQLNTTHLRIPDDLPAGEYTLELSLFDPNQMKNAVFFDPVAPATPLVTIQRQLIIQ